MNLEKVKQETELVKRLYQVFTGNYYKNDDNFMELLSAIKQASNPQKVIYQIIKSKELLIGKNGFYYQIFLESTLRDKSLEFANPDFHLNENVEMFDQPEDVALYFIKSLLFDLDLYQRILPNTWYSLAEYYSKNPFFSKEQNQKKLV